jgi:hypothetical protein
MKMLHFKLRIRVKKYSPNHLLSHAASKAIKKYD